MYQHEEISIHLLQWIRIWQLQKISTLQLSARLMMCLDTGLMNLIRLIREDEMATRGLCQFPSRCADPIFKRPVRTHLDTDMCTQSANHSAPGFTEDDTCCRCVILYDTLVLKNVCSDITSINNDLKISLYFAYISCFSNQ